MTKEYIRKLMDPNGDWYLGDAFTEADLWEIYNKDGLVGLEELQNRTPLVDWVLAGNTNYTRRALYEMDHKDLNALANERDE